MKQQDLVDVSTAPDVQTFEKLLVRFANALDFGIISGSVVVDQAPGNALFIPFGNTPEAFSEVHRNLDKSLRDPVLKRLKQMSVPFTYDQDLYVSEGSADLWDLQAPYGYHAGIAMALHLPAGKHFLLGVDRDRPLPSDDGTLTRQMADLQLLAAYAQGAALRLLLTAPEKSSKDVRLTPREVEVLRWAMEGKSTWDISRILNVSEFTVNYHVRNANLKLGASTRTQAVARALAAGLL